MSIWRKSPYPKLHAKGASAPYRWHPNNELIQIPLV